ncbi:hypothetical protein CVV38_04475 [Candidatus Peregrinibacteria bacterium HGW-Peregrinibacteria-1]|jgi:competence protein ComEC|nr:MAG: hypothetical protein CVV38_04475 [Candidatus Peregrinibacteria bacterium HGW-Peregrinibacteria-1]
MNIGKLFLLFLVAFLVGVLGYSLFIEVEMFVFAGFSLMVLILFVRFFIREFGGAFRVGIVIVVMFLLGLSWGILRSHFYFEFPEKTLSLFLGDVEVEGCIVAEPDVRSGHVKYVIDVHKVLSVQDEDVGLWNVVDKFGGSYGKVMINGPKYPRFKYGDCLFVRGENYLAGEFEGFSYEKYLVRFGIYSLIRPYEMKVVRQGSSGGMSLIFQVKSKFDARINAIFGEPSASFMAGLLVGSRRGIPADLMENFNRTGLTHIIAISGYNITLLILIVSKLFSFVSQKLKIIFSIILIVLFVIFVGAGAGVVRAGIMGSFSLIVLWFGRSYLVAVALIFTAFVMAAINPRILFYDVSFQLSFLATWGVVYFNEIVGKYFQWLPGAFEIRDSVVVTLAAQVLVLPVIVWNFERLSLISPVANLFILPWIPWTMILGFIAVLVSFVWWPLGVLIGFVGYLILEFMVFIVEVLAGVDFGYLSFVFPWWAGVIYFYFFLDYLIFGLKEGEKTLGN